MGIIRKLLNVLHPFEVKEYNVYADLLDISKSLQSKVECSDVKVSDTKNGLGLKIKILCPLSYENAAELVDILKSGRTIAVSFLKGVDRGDVRRIIDFLSGAVYMSGGQIKSLSYNLYLVTPYKIKGLEDAIIDGLEAREYGYKSSITI